MRHFSDWDDDENEKPRRSRRDRQDEDDGYSGGMLMSSFRSQMADGWIPTDNPYPTREQDIPDPYKKLRFLWRSTSSIDHSSNESENIFLDVIKRYCESHRGYHGISHLEYLSEHFDKIEYLLGKDRDAFIFAIFFHDIIYNCQSKLDEEMSSNLAKNFLKKLDCPQEIIDRTSNLILATSRAKPDQGDYVMALFLDMDRSILGARTKQYKEYLLGVQKEFCMLHNITPDQFLAARVDRFVKPTLTSEEIFTTDIYRRFEKKARTNLRSEIANIQSRPSDPHL